MLSKQECFEISKEADATAWHKDKQNAELIGIIKRMNIPAVPVSSTDYKLLYKEKETLTRELKELEHKFLDQEDELLALKRELTELYDEFLGLDISEVVDIKGHNQLFFSRRLLMPWITKLRSLCG